MISKIRINNNTKIAYLGIVLVGFGVREARVRRLQFFSVSFCSLLLCPFPIHHSFIPLTLHSVGNIGFKIRFLLFGIYHFLFQDLYFVLLSHLSSSSFFFFFFWKGRNPTTLLQQNLVTTRFLHGDFYHLILPAT